MNEGFFTDTLPDATAKLVGVFQEHKPDFLAPFYLTGGTGLALHLGHRESEDLDFFSRQPFSPGKLQSDLVSYGKLEQVELAAGTLNAFLNGVKLQFLEYPYDLLEPLLQWRSIKLSSVLDIGCTKLHTIGMRGGKKDFIDLFFILEKYSLQELLAATARKYPGIEYSQTHILKSLIYFDDAEQQPLPRIHRDIAWRAVKDRMTQVAKDMKFA